MPARDSHGGRDRPLHLSEEGDHPMAWSKWRGVLLLTALASVGLAWSQSPTLNRQTTAPERIMTVHENGKSLRCRVLQSWRTANGSLAHQLQVIETGELMTIVEDGPATPVTNSSGAQVRAMPMRIFHWGQRRSAPPGAPVPPMLAETWEPGVKAAGGVEPAVVHETTRSAPGSSVIIPCDPAISGRSPRVIPCPDPQERIIAWDEKTGKPVTLGTGPIVVDGVRTIGPIIVDGSPIKPASESALTMQPGGIVGPTGRQPLFPRLMGARNEPGVISEKVISTQPGEAAAQSPQSGPVVTENNVITMQPAGTVRIPQSGPIVISEKAISTLPAGATAKSPQSGPVVISEKVISTQPAGGTVRNPQSGPVVISEKVISTQPVGGTAQNPKAGPVVISEKVISTQPVGGTAQNPKAGPVVISEKVISTQPVGGTAQNPKAGPVAISEKVLSTSPESASTQQPRTSLPTRSGSPTTISEPITSKTTSIGDENKGPKTSLTMRERIKGLFSRSTTAKPAEPKPMQTAQAGTKPTQLPTTSSVQAGKKEDLKSLQIPSTAQATKKVEQTPAQLPAPTPAAVAKKEEKPFSTATTNPAGTTKEAPIAMPGAATARQAPKAGGPTADAVRPVSAKSEPYDWRKMWVSQADAKTEQPGQSTIDREKVRNELPPVSQTVEKKQDILMAPEKFNPESEKANPKVPAQMAGVAPSAIQQVGNLPTPLGVQSVLSARNGAQGPVQYIPVPVATVPEPIRPPTPPEPRLPEPPNPTMYVNAFTPPPNPQGQAPMMPPQGMPHYPMGPWAPMPNRMPANAAQLIPVHYGRPMQVTYPANYGGPQPPNPIAQQQPYNGVQQAGYQMMPQGNALVNQAMDRRVVPAAAQQPAGNDASNLGQLIKILQESPYPAQREWAATNLSTFDWRVYPHLPQVLVQAARQDAVGSVRAASVYSLARMNLQGEPVLSTLQALRGDADPRVRQEVEQAYLRMNVAPPQ
jgi:hypothetical protein